MKEVAHDYQPQIQKYLEKEIQCRNSFDTWHGIIIYMEKSQCMRNHAVYRHQECG